MARCRIKYSGVLEDGSSIKRFGTGEAPIKEVTVDGDVSNIPSRCTLAPGESVDLWVYGDSTRAFETIIGHIVSGDYLVLSFLVAKDSGDDGLPEPNATFAWRWRHQDVSNLAPFCISSDRPYMNTNAVSAAAEYGNITAGGYTADGQSGIDGADPQLFAVTNDNGKIYKVRVGNPDVSEDDVVVEWAVIRRVPVA